MEIRGTHQLPLELLFSLCDLLLELRKHGLRLFEGFTLERDLYISMIESEGYHEVE